MKKYILLPLLLLVFALVQTENLQAQSDMKIGYVEPMVILERMPEMASIERRLQNFMERKNREIADKEMELAQRLEDFQRRRSVISAEAREREEESLTSMQVELQQLQGNAQQELQQQQIELISPVIDKIQTAIDEVAAEMGLTYVLNTMTNNGDFIILYVSEEVRSNYNITEKVMTRLDI
jgi:outer membrane protein